MGSVSGHDTVLLHEACEALIWNADGLYVDGTFGRGGHSAELLARLSASGRLIAFDKDPEAVVVGQELQGQDSRFTIKAGSFTGLEHLANEPAFQGGCAGVLLDLGVSSPQIDVAERGFSFMKDGPLDMRMDPDNGQSAAQWLATVDEQDLVSVLKTLGEERYAKRIAGAIVAERQVTDITRTVQLAELIKLAHPRWEKDKHPATKSFQAIRIHLNRELVELEEMLTLAESMLCVGGRLVVISFHSLEDRITKRFMRNASRSSQASAPRHIPLQDHQDEPPSLRLIGKAVRCSAEEVSSNRRARSAVMRVAEKAGKAA
ncbi:MAG: 16S rRNA (cytosine(1402)-N(4))-methyltransferase RsmH [Pseudomonadales bacterium]